MLKWIKTYFFYNYLYHIKYNLKGFKPQILVYTKYKSEGNFCGRVHKIRHDENGVRITYIKALGGKLKVRDEISYGDEENRISEKATQIRVIMELRAKP